jgi:hypothetical protein
MSVLVLVMFQVHVCPVLVHMHAIMTLAKHFCKDIFVCVPGGGEQSPRSGPRGLHACTTFLVKEFIFRCTMYLWRIIN